MLLVTGLRMVCVSPPSWVCVCQVPVASVSGLSSVSLPIRSGPWPSSHPINREVNAYINKLLDPDLLHMNNERLGGGICCT